METLSTFIGFEWDKGNKDKNWVKHRVSDAECEEVFFNIPLVVFPDKVHSRVEDRYYLLGRTDGDRLLFIVFTMRGDKIRIISARDVTRKERKCYYEETKENYT